MILFLLSLIQLSISVQAFDNSYLMRSPKALLMGDAFTAVNDDEFTLFYNPAALGRHKYDLTLTPLNAQVTGTNILSDMDKFKNFPSDPVGVSNVIMDYPVHAGASFAPGLKLFNFGVNFIGNQNYDLLLRNRAHPMLDVDLRDDKGFIAGFAIPLGGQRIGKKSSRGSQTSLGFSGKFIQRTGLRDTLALAGPTVLKTLDENELNKIVNSLGKATGKAYGFDMGLEHIYREGNSQYVFALSALDITGTDFKVEKNINNTKVSNINDQVNLGFAFGQNYNYFNYILSADVRSLNEQMDFGKRLRLGGQLGVPGLKILAGMNSGYYSYGAMLDFPLFKVTAGFYDQELGTSYKQVKSKRFVIYLSLFDFSFDA